MSQRDPASENGPALSYLGLRRGVGFLGMTLPIVLIVGKALLDGGGILGSISGYYYTTMRDYFVGTMCAMAVLLVSYRYRREDNHLSNAIAVVAVGVALFPTNPAGTRFTTGQTIVGYVHLTCAGLFFAGMAFFSFSLFTRTDPQISPTRQKRQRNLLYRACGIAIMACLALMVVTNIVATDRLKGELHPVLWLECIAVWAFSVSWLIKGEFLFLKDEPANRAPVEPTLGKAR